ncbi:MAG: hypothetical protein HXY30_02040 [Pseudorhodoplanes sp.]|nr:hypothetical protein [Pseudorhodoplanes sp.]
MSLKDWVEDLPGRLQKFATEYFGAMHKVGFAFWQLPDLPGGSNILTGSFAGLLIALAQAHMSQDIRPEAMALTIGITFFFILLISGILLFLDPYRTGEDYQKLVAVVCAGVTLGCAFIVLDMVVPWIDRLWLSIRPYDPSSSAANVLIAGIAVLLVGILLWLNTIYQTGLRSYFTSLRMVAWTVAILGVVGVGVSLIISGAEFT